MVMQSRSGFRFLASTSVSLASLVALLAVSRNANATPLFTEGTLKSLGIGSSQACADSGDPGCYTNWFELVDIDNDKDFDIVMANGGGVFAPANLEASVVYLNDGKGAFLNAMNTIFFEGAPSQLRQIAVGDIDGDGDLDIYQPGAFGTDDDKLWVQTSQRVFADQASTLLPPPAPLHAALASHAGATHFGDLDGDGDLDLVVADWGDASADTVSRLLLYSNDGNGRFTLTEAQSDNPAATAHLPSTIPATSRAPYFGSRPTDLDFADVDGDFDLDILEHHRQGQSRIFLNDGHGYFKDGTGFTGTLAAGISANYAPKRGPYSNNQEACDLDDDGDLDLLLDNAGLAPGGTPSGLNVTQLLLNDGHGVFVDQTATRILGEPASQDGAAKCADVNGDGHYDIVVGSRSHSSEKVLLNDGTGIFSYAADALPKFTDTTLAIDLGDLDGDGKLDLVTGQGEGTISTSNAATLRNNRVYYGLAADVTPPRFRAIETPAGVPGAPIVFRMAVSDSATNQAGQMATVTVPYTIKGLTKQAKVSFIGGDLFRVTIPAQADGTVLSYAPTAVDRAKLEHHVSLVLIVGTAPPVIGTGGAINTNEGGASGANERGESGASGAHEGGASGEPSIATGSGGTQLGSGTGVPSLPRAGSGGQASMGTPSGGTGGALPDGGEAGADDSSSPSSASSKDGCSCSMIPTNGTGGILQLGLGLSLLGLARRRQRRPGSRRA